MVYEKYLTEKSRSPSILIHEKANLRILREKQLREK